MPRSLVHPRRMASLANHFPQTVSFSGVGGGSGSFDSGGRRNRITNVTAVSGLANLPCQINPLLGQRETPGAGEGESAVSTHEITFNAYYENLSTGMVATDDDTGDVYNVTSVDRDATSSFSVIVCSKSGK